MSNFLAVRFRMPKFSRAYQERIEDLQVRILGLEKARKDLTNQYAEA